MTASTAPLHAFMIHFPIAAWVLGALCLSGALFLTRVRDQLNWTGWLLLGVAALWSIPAAVTGQYALDGLVVLDDPVLSRHQDLGNVTPWLMGLIVLGKLHSRFGKQFKPPAWVWVVAATGVAILVLYVGYLGGILVHVKDLKG